MWTGQHFFYIYRYIAEVGYGRGRVSGGGGPTGGENRPRTVDTDPVLQWYRANGICLPRSGFSNQYRLRLPPVRYALHFLLKVSRVGATGLRSEHHEETFENVHQIPYRRDYRVQQADVFVIQDGRECRFILYIYYNIRRINIDLFDLWLSYNIGLYK